MDGEDADGFTNVNDNQSQSEGGMGYIQSGPPSLASHRQGLIQYEIAVNSIVQAALNTNHGDFIVSSLSLGWTQDTINICKARRRGLLGLPVALSPTR